MIAGMYLGEIVRLILLDLCKQGVVFGEEALDVLETKGKHSKGIYRLNSEDFLKFFSVFIYISFDLLIP